MPQERITVKFCRQHKVAQLIRSPSELAKTIAEWKQRPELPERIRQAMKEACPPSHPLDIVRMVASLTADNNVAARIPIVEAARIAQQAEQRALEKSRPLSLSPADVDSQ
jgi:hypothetical protein